MTGYEVQQSTASYPLMFLLVLSSDHITGATGLSPTVTLSKNGGSFASPAGAVTEVANGWYKVAGNATDTNTLGPLVLHASVATADPVDIIFPVVAVNPQDAVRYGLTALPNASAAASGGLPTIGVTIPNATAGAAGGLFIAGTNAATTITTSLTTHIVGTVDTVTTLTNLPSAPTDWLTAASVKADAVTKIQAGLSTYAGGDTSGTTTLLGRIGSAITITAGGVTLANGVAHGGTPGSSTATFAMKSVTALNPDNNGVAVTFGATGSSSTGLWCYGNYAGCELDANDTNGACLALFASDGSCIHGQNSSASNPTLDLNNSAGTCVSLASLAAGDTVVIAAGGAGKKALLLSAAAATDSFAIAAGAGSPIDVFNADGSVNVGGIEASALAEFFTTNSTKLFSDAVVGSVVKEIATNASGGTSGPTASQVATAVWQDATSGDFAVSGSIGKSLFTGGAVPGASGGLFIAGTNAATTVTTSFTTTFTGNLTGNVGGNVTGTTGGMTAAGLARFFTVDTTKVFADAINGSVVKEISTGTGSDPWAVPVPGSYLAGTAGYILGNRLDASITSRSTYSGTDTPGILTLLSRIGGAITINEGGVAIDWANVVNPGATVNLANTTISSAQVIASVSGNVGGNVTGTIGGLTAAALAQFFTVNTTKVYADAVAGSVVHETASNSSGGGSGLTAADVWSYATRTLTSLGAVAPAGWIDAASIVDHALDGKGDWSTYAGGDTAGVTTLLSRIGGAITISGGGVNVNLAQTLSSARALDSTADTSLTLNDAMHCAIAGAAGQRVEDKNALTYTQKTPFTATVIRTFSIDSAAAPTRRT